MIENRKQNDIYFLVYTYDKSEYSDLLRAELVIDQSLFVAYEKLRDLVQKFDLKLDIPRVVFVGDTSSGKSMYVSLKILFLFSKIFLYRLVQNFLRFPCTVSNNDVSTRCPVSYKLRYDRSLVDGQIHFNKPKGMTADKLGSHLKDVMEKIANDCRENGGFTREPYEIDISSNQYTDFEILDVRGLVSGEENSQHRMMVETITEFYVRDPQFMIVHVKPADTIGEMQPAPYVFVHSARKYQLRVARIIQLDRTTKTTQSPYKRNSTSS